MRHAARRDMNEQSIVRALRAVGADVASISQAGVPDLLVSYRGHIYLIEVIGPDKDTKYRKTGGLTPAQVRWRERHPGISVSKVMTAQQALEVVGAVRAPGLVRLVPEPGELDAVFAQVERRRKK